MARSAGERGEAELTHSIDLLEVFNVHGENM